MTISAGNQLALAYARRLTTTPLSDLLKLAPRSKQYLAALLNAYKSTDLSLGNIERLDQLTHTEHLRYLTKATLTKDFDRYVSLMGTLIDSIEITLQDISSKPLRQKRLNGLLRTFAKLTGNLLVSNRHFLATLGKLYDDRTAIQRVANIYLDTLLLTEKSLEAPIGSFERLLDDRRPDYHAAVSSAGNTASYLLRLANTYGAMADVEDLVAPALQERPSILVSAASFAQIPFYDAKSIALLSMRRAVKDLDATLKRHSSSEVSERNSESKLQSTSRIRHTLSRAKSNLGFIDSVANSDPIAFEMERMKFEQEFLEARKPIEKMASGIASVRRFVTSDNYRALSETLDRLLRDGFLRHAAYDNPSFLARMIEAETLLSELSVIGQYQDAVDQMRHDGLLQVPTGGGPEKRILLFAFDQDRVLPLVVLPFLPFLRRNGFEFYNICDDGFVNESVPLWPFSETLSPDFRNTMGTSAQGSRLMKEWTVRPEDGVIECEGINFYQGIYERVGRVMKVFDVDWSLPTPKLFLGLWLSQLDRLLHCLGQVKSVAKARGYRITLCSLQSHFTPYFGLKAYADGNSDVFEHVTFGSSYENWTSNLSGAPLSSVTLQNNTRDRVPSLPAFGLPDHFEEWRHTVYDAERGAFQRAARDLVSLQRGGALSAQGTALIDQAKSIKESLGGSTLCMIGKIPYDLGVPTQGGPCHRNMKDWVNHTIQSVDGSNCVLFIKPHPHELVHSIAGGSRQGFLDLIECDLPDNVVILPHRGVSLQHLFGTVDVFLAWNGSSIAELGSQGQKVVACDSWAACNYPVGVYMPRNRSHYQAIVRGLECVEMMPEFASRCEAYVAYMARAPFAFRFPFVERSSTNINFNWARIHSDALTSGNLAALYQENEILLRRVFMGERCASTMVVPAVGSLSNWAVPV